MVEQVRKWVYRTWPPPVTASVSSLVVRRKRGKEKEKKEGFNFSLECV